jgi:hypothetical protein
MRFFQLTSKTRLVAGDARECEEAILKVTRQKGSVLLVLDRLSLGVQQALYSLDDFIAMDQEKLEKFDMGVKRHLAETLCGWPLLNRFAHRLPARLLKCWTARVDSRIVR